MSVLREQRIEWVSPEFMFPVLGTASEVNWAERARCQYFFQRLFRALENQTKA